MEGMYISERVGKILYILPDPKEHEFAEHEI